jgi:hypothetical protein
VAAPLVSVLLVLYNSAEHLDDCLQSLLADAQSPPFEILAVDNASADDGAARAEAWAARSSRLRVLRNASNRGYAGGVNTALPHARGEFVAVLNPDSVVEPGWLTPVIELMQARPEVGAVSPLILLHASENRDNNAARDRINSAGQNVHVTGLGFNCHLWRPRAVAGSEPVLVSGLHGAAFVIRRALLGEMKGWDESGFLYHEDVALSWLLQVMGYDLYCVPASVVWHKYHLTMYPEKLFLLERNRWALLLTHLGEAARVLLAPLLLFTEGLMWGYCLLRGPGFLRAKWASYRWVGAQASQLRERRHFIQTLRRRSDWQVLRRLRWNYDWDQFFSLGRERGVSTRQPVGGMPVQIDSSE